MHETKDREETVGTVISLDTVLYCITDNVHSAPELKISIMIISSQL